VLELTGNARRFKSCFACSPKEYKVAKATWKEHKREEAEALEDLLAEALGPLGASEASLLSFKKYLKKNEVGLEDLEGVKKLKDIDGCAHARKKREKKRKQSKKSTSKHPSMSRRSSVSRRSRAGSISGWSRMSSITSVTSHLTSVSRATTSRRESKTPNRAWPPRRESAATSRRSKSSVVSRVRRGSTCPARAWPPGKCRRNTEPPLNHREFRRAVRSVA